MALGRSDLLKEWDSVLRHDKNSKFSASWKRVWKMFLKSTAQMGVADPGGWDGWMAVG